MPRTLHRCSGTTKNHHNVDLLKLVILNSIISLFLPVMGSSTKIDEKITTNEKDKFFYNFGSAILTNSLNMDKKVRFDLNKKQKQKTDNHFSSSSVNIELVNTKKEENSEKVKPKFNRNQWEAAANTFPIIPLSGYTKSDGANVSFFNNDGTFFTLMIAFLPIVFAALFLGLGSLMDVDDIPFLLPFLDKYRI